MRQPTSLVLVFFLALPVAAEDQKILRHITPDKLESLLKDLKLDFKKTDGKKEGIHYYDIEQSNMRVRLHNYNGKDLWIDALFHEKLGLEEVNRWNARSKFSRVVLLKDKDQTTLSLESQLDCLGGVTEAMVKQFVTRFENETREFVKFVTKP